MMHRIKQSLVVVALCVPALGAAQEEAGEIEFESAPLSAWEALAALPPKATYEVGLHISYGTVAYFRDSTPPWVGFGIHAGGGRMLDRANRLGGGLAINLEGPVPLYYSASLEPQVMWDRVMKGLQLGASLGPAIMLHSELQVSGAKNAVTVSPMAALRVGYSEPWSRIGRRFFAVLEPKGRVIWHDDVAVPDISVALVVGSGRGVQ